MTIVSRVGAFYSKITAQISNEFDVRGLLRCSASGHLLSENPEAAADSFAMTEAFPRAASQSKVKISLSWCQSWLRPRFGQAAP